MRATLLTLLFFISTINYSTGQEKVIYLQNESIKAGFLPDVGGRMVFFSMRNKENILSSDEKLWNESSDERIQPSVKARFKPYNGFITWVGPQSEWWSHQELIPSKKGAVWPPDPWLIYGDFKVLKHTNTELLLEGPESPISGVKLAKRYVLNGPCLEIEVTAKNSRATSVSWDLWSNARFSAYTKFEIPVTPDGIHKVEAKETNWEDKVRYEIIDGNFVFYPELPSGNKRQRVSKAFLYPEEGRIVVKKDDLKLTIAFDRVPKHEIHPEQALVEVYNCITANGFSDILELEHHSAYKTLLPGETMTLKETWSIEKH